MAAASPPVDAEEPRCFVCLDPAKPDDALCSTGCACRGDSAGLLHFVCAVGAAQVNGRSWFKCLTCQQQFTGAFCLRLARERCRLCADRPEEDEERLGVAVDLVEALWRTSALTEALQLGIETLSIARRVFGDEDDYTLRAMGRLAVVHSDMEDPAAALALQTEVLAVRRRVSGDDHPGTLAAMNNPSVTHMNNGDSAAALPLAREALGSKRRTLGNDDESTIVSIAHLADVHSSMGNHDLVLPLGREALETSRRVFGSQHLQTFRSAGNLGGFNCRYG